MAEIDQLERAIAVCFGKIADNGWFPPQLHDAETSPQWRMVRDTVQPKTGMRILDAGCARGRFLRELRASGAELFGVDLTGVFLRDARHNVPEARLAQATVRHLPFADASYHAVLCIETLQHVADTAAALAELARVLKPGGRLLILDRNLSGLHPRYGLPAAWVKRWQERKGKWMYPRDFAFRERWFRPRELAEQMAEFCTDVEVRFMTEGHGRASTLYRKIPVLACDAAWMGRKISAP